MGRSNHLCSMDYSELISRNWGYLTLPQQENIRLASVLLAGCGLGSNVAVLAAEAANNVGEVMEMAEILKLPLGDQIARQAREVALATLSGDTDVEVFVINRQGEKVGHAG